MRLKTLVLGAGGLALLAVLTFALNARRNAPVAEGRVGKPLIQNLDMGKVARMTLTTESTVTLEKSADGAWVVAEQGRFIADEVKLRGLLLKLTEQAPERLVTQSEDRLADLQLLVPQGKSGSGKKEAAGVLISLLDEANQPLHRVLLGKRRSGGSGQYVRFPDDPASYIIGETLQVEPDAWDWIEKGVLNEDSATLTRVRVERPGEPAFELFRDKAEAPWQVQGGAPKPVNQDEVRILSNTLAGLDVARVAEEKAEAKALGRERVSRVTMTLFDGRRYTLTVGTAQVGEFRYLGVEGALTDKAPEEAKKTALERFNRLYAGRVFALNNHDGVRVQRPLKDYLSSK